MARAKKPEKKAAKNGANLGFEQTLWQAADKLRGNMDAADYKHVVPGLIFLKYISDAFEERHTALVLTRKASLLTSDADFAQIEKKLDIIWAS